MVIKDWTASSGIAFFMFALRNSLYTGPHAQSVTCLAADTFLTADPGVASLIPAESCTMSEIDREIISTVIFLPSADSRRL